MDGMTVGPERDLSLDRLLGLTDMIEVDDPFALIQGCFKINVARTRLQMAMASQVGHKVLDTFNSVWGLCRRLKREKQENAAFEKSLDCAADHSVDAMHDGRIR